jgi:hypothetical protein
MRIEHEKWKMGNEAARKFRRVVFVALLFSIFNFQFSILTSCARYDTECELVLQPRVMVSQGSDPLTPAYMARVYVWYITEKEYLDNPWRPASWADAQAGVVRHRETGEMRSFGLTGVQSDEDGFIRVTLTRSPVLLVAVDPVNSFYAWRTFEFNIPLESVLVPVTFRTYYDVTQIPYRQEEWTVTSLEKETTPPPTEEE